MPDMLNDPRFSHIARDPKFRRIPKSERKVKIDKRFKRMFTDKNFLVHHTIDKRGRPINTTSAVDLKKFYDQSSSDEENEKQEEEEGTDPEEDEKVPKKPDEKLKKKKVKKSKKIKKDAEELEEDSSDSLEEPDEELKDNNAQLNLKLKNEITKVDVDTKKKLKDLACDYARGEGVLFSESSSSDESSEEEDANEEEEVDHNWGELDKEAETTEEATSRLAACNMDWDKLRAVDLLVLFNSFLPPGGLVHSVTIYPSDYGVKRMQEEDVKGPIELVDSSKQREDDEESDENDNEEGSAYTMEKMRQYQLNRLKYYYAVIKFDSATTANKIYTECDGLEYESTSTKLDLRFIPEDMEFEHEPKEICDKLPDPSKYVPRLFTTTALQQVKVDLTWDETKPERQEITQKLNSGKIDDVDEHDIQTYLASGTSDEESDGEQEENEGESDGENKKSSLDKYKLLLQSIQEKEEEKKNKDIGLEFTWGLGEKEKAEKLVKERMKKAEHLTPHEQFLEKRKEKKKLKREEKKKKKQSGDREEENDDDDGSESEDIVPSDVDMNDPFFAEEMKNMKAQKMRKKSSKKNKNDSDDDDSVDEEEEAQRKAELELLLLDGDDEREKQHFNMKQIEENEALTKSKKKRLIKKQKNKKTSIEEDNFEVDVNDPRFAALYNSHLFNIDPADPHYRKTKGSEALISEKLKRRAEGDTLDVPEKIPKQSKETRMKHELAALVNSVKRNTKNNCSQKNK